MPQAPMVVSTCTQPTFRTGAVERLAPENDEEQNALQHEDRGVRQILSALQHAAGGHESAEQQGDDEHAGGIVAGEEGNQDTYVTVAGVDRGIGASLYGGHLDHARETGTGSAEEAEGKQHPSDAESGELGG